MKCVFCPSGGNKPDCECEKDLGIPRMSTKVTRHALKRPTHQFHLPEGRGSEQKGHEQTGKLIRTQAGKLTDLIETAAKKKKKQKY